MAYGNWVESESPATGVVAVYRVFVTMLVAAGWTKAADSDGTTYSASGAQVTSGASGAGGLGNNSAWVRMRAPTGTREICIQRGTSDTQWRAKYSASAGFTGGSPGATQTPSATDEQLILGAGSNASPTYTSWFNTNNTYRLFGGADSAAPYNFWFACVPNGGGDPNAGFVFDPVASPDEDDQDPAVAYIGLVSLNAFKASTLGSTNSAATVSRAAGWLKYNDSGSFVAIPGNYLASSSGALFPGLGGSNPHSGKDNTVPVVWWRGSAQATPYGYKGVSRVLMWNSVTRSSGETFTVSTTRDRISIGDVSLPWGGAEVTL